MSTNVSGSAKGGIAWVLGTNLVNQLLQFGVGVVLARLLSPKDFGIFAISGIFTGLAATVSSFGLGAALVQRSAVREAHLRSMLTANLIGSAALVLLLSLAAPLVGWVFKSPLAGLVLTLTAWNFLIGALGSVSFSLMNRALRFRELARIEAGSAMANGAVAIILALQGAGVWAIAWAGIAQSLVRTALLIARGGWRPAFGRDREALRELVGFGAGLTLKRVLNYCAANVDYAVVGRRLSTTDLGFYSRAYGLMTLPLSQLSRVIMSVLFPTFSRIQDDNRKIIAGYSKVVTVTALVSFPFLVGLGLVAPAFIHAIYGEKWMPVVLPLQIMCVAGMMKSLTTYVGAIVDAKGKIAAEVRRQIVYLVLLVVGTYFGSTFGTAGVAVAVVGASLVMLVMMQSLLGQLTGMRWREYFAAIAPALAGSAAMAGAVLAWQAVAAQALGPTSAALLFTSAAIGAAAYAGVIFGVPFARVRSLHTELSADLRRMRARGRAGQGAEAGEGGAPPASRTVPPAGADSPDQPAVKTG